MYLAKCTYCQYLTGKAGMKRTEPIKDNPSPPLPNIFSFYLVYTCINVCHAVADSLTRNLFEKKNCVTCGNGTVLTSIVSIK